MEYDKNIELTSHEVCEILGVTRAMLSLWKAKGKGPAFEMVPTVSETSRAMRYRYRLGAVLNFMSKRGEAKSAIEAARRKALNQRRLKLARAADQERIKAMSAIRKARSARELAALAGHRPSIAIFARGDF